MEDIFFKCLLCSSWALHLQGITSKRNTTITKISETLYIYKIEK